MSLSSLRYNAAPLPSSALLVAHLHAARCSATPPGGDHYRQNTSLPDDALSVPPPAGSGQGTNTFSVRVPSSGVASAAQPLLVDYDRALSVILHEGGNTSGYSPTSPGSRIGARAGSFVTGSCGG